MKNREELPTGSYAVSGTIDAHPPRRIARIVEDVGVRKARMDTLPLVVLGFLGGVYIGFGAMLCTVILADPTLSPSIALIGSGLAFSAGFVLVILAGAELFSGNMLTVLAWAHGRIALAELRRVWAIVFLANFAGALAAAWVAREAGVYRLGGDGLATAAAAIAVDKTEIAFWPAFLRGVLANILICVGFWLCMATQTVTDRILSIVIPVTLLTAMGFEHSVTNMYLVPAGMMHGAEEIGLAALLGSLVPVTLGNIVGGGVFVAAVYWAVYLVPNRPDAG